jgi:hypothetical protein
VPFGWIGGVRRPARVVRTGAGELERAQHVDAEVLDASNDPTGRSNWRRSFA